MFVRTKKSGAYQYLQIVENERIDGKVRQRVIVTLGRLDRYNSLWMLYSLYRGFEKDDAGARRSLERPPSRPSNTLLTILLGTTRRRSGPFLSTEVIGIICQFG